MKVAVRPLRITLLCLAACCGLGGAHAGGASEAAESVAPGPSGGARPAKDPAGASTEAARGQARLARLVPMPRDASSREGAGFAWGDGLEAVVEPGNEADAFAAETLREACRQRGIGIPVVRASADPGEASANRRLLIGAPDRLPSVRAALAEAGVAEPAPASDGAGEEKRIDGYVLLVTADRIVVAAATPPGIYYGVQTLIQLLPARDAAAIPALVVRDWSELEVRSVSIDMYAGEVYQMAGFEETIRRLAHYKLNQLVMYLEDAFLFPSHPAIGEDRDRVTTEQMQQLSAFARRHHVDIAPSYDTPAHMGRTLGHPKYAHLRESPAGDVINLTHPETYPLLRELYADLCRAFPGPYNYASVDEIFGVGTGASRETLRKEGLQALYLRHVEFLHEILEQCGKTMYLSADPLDPVTGRRFAGIGYVGIQTLDRLPHDVVIGSWNYFKVERFSFGDEVRARGFRQLLLTSTHATRRIFPHYSRSAMNITSFAPHAYRLGALGLVCTDWNRWGENTFYELNWPLFAFFADWAWSESGRSIWPTMPAIVETFYGEGAAPIADTLEFLSSLNRYFGWARRGLRPPDFTLFFAELEPARLNQPKEKKLERFRLDWAEARRAFEQGKAASRLRRPHLDFVELALDQQKLLADLVEARHALALAGASEGGEVDRVPGEREKRRKEAVRLLEALAPELRALTERYVGLWNRVNMPLGLRPNLARFEAVQASVDRALARANAGLGRPETAGHPSD